MRKRGALLLLFYAFAIGGIVVSPARWSAAAAGEAVAEPRALIVRLNASGSEALPECAEALWRSGRSVRSVCPDCSDALDRFHARFRTRNVRALFRRSAEERDLAAGRSRLAARGRRLAASMARGRSTRTGGRPSAAAATAEAALRDGLGQRMAGLADVYRFELPADADVAEALRVLKQAPGVAFVQVDHGAALDRLLDDPYLSSRGAWGQPYADLWGLDRIRAPEAWDLSEGEGVVIAVVDTGLDTAHPDMAANVWVNPGEDLDANGRVDATDWNAIDDDGNGFVDDLQGWNFVGHGDTLEDGTVFLGTPNVFDDRGHGSHVAGTAAAVGDNGIGIAGVAPRARVMPLKGFPAQGAGRESDLWRAVLYAVEQGARVVNASWSCSPACPQNPLAAEVLAIAEAAGVVFVTSAGNDSSDVIASAPENTRAAITVGSIGFDDRISSFSNVGFGIDIVAPGGGPFSPVGVLFPDRNILSIRSSGTPEIEAPHFVGDAYYRLSGTSMAAPVVSGAVAVLLAQRPALSYAEVRTLLRLSARDRGAPGHDPIYGPGVLDLRALLDTASPDVQLELRSPVPTQILDPADGPIDIQGAASGSDLLAYSLAYARGLDGGRFVEIERGSAREDGIGTLATWDVASLADGPIVLRLRGELRDGRRVDEYAVVSLERNAPLRLSDDDDGEHAAPALSGASAVWISRGSGADGADRIALGGFDGRRGVRAPRILTENDRLPHDPLIASDRVVWLERDPETKGDRLMTCRIEPAGPEPGAADRSRSTSVRPDDDGPTSASARNGRARCRPTELLRSAIRLDPIALAKERLLWSVRSNGLFGILECTLRGGRGCTSPIRLPDAAAESESVRLLAFDGRSVLWIRGTVPAVLQICSIDSSSGVCEVPPVTLDLPSSVNSASIDGTRLALELFGIEGSSILHCDFDLQTGGCDPRFVLNGPEGEIPELGQLPVVSGNRIAWQRIVRGEPSSIAYCEIDPIDGECRMQRVTGGFLPSESPDLDGDRIVWKDQRSGPARILGSDLPRLRAPSTLRLRAGRRAVAWIESSDPAGGPLAIRLEGAMGLTPEDVGARVITFGSASFAILVVDPDDASLGETGRWRLIGEAKGGWTTQRAIDVGVSRGSIGRPLQSDRSE